MLLQGTAPKLIPVWRSRTQPNKWSVCRWADHCLLVSAQPGAGSGRHSPLYMRRPRFPDKRQRLASLDVLSGCPISSLVALRRSLFAARSLRAMCGRFSHRYTWAEIHRADGGTNPSINILAASASRSVTSINPAVSAFRRATIYLKLSETGHRGLLGMRPNIIGRNDIQRTIPSRYVGTPLGGVGSDRIVATPFGCLFRIATSGYHLSQSTVERMRHGKRFGATNRHRSETMKSLQRSAASPHRRLHGRFRLFHHQLAAFKSRFKGAKSSFEFHKN